MRKKIVIVLLITVAASLALPTPHTQKEEKYQEISILTKEVEDNAGSPSIQEPIILVRTIDGDTIKVKYQGKTEKIRYLLIDTPEMKRNGKCLHPYALEAFQRNDQLVKIGNLTMELEQGNFRDAYGRLLAYVYVDGKSVQETLLKEGYARVAYVINPPYKFLAKYKDEERLAKSSKINIWSHPNYVTKWGFNGCVQ
ncbi:thermonuclease family protein [Neobacillus bataviensis]|uniref:thermonuclease family protein n=1 Tax=Neobacillus bataviensis TaxID=220685 RepID=UPI001CBE2AE8|nr:thermonuclease family protein [Neobacillus bataviensis]